MEQGRTGRRFRFAIPIQGASRVGAGILSSLVLILGLVLCAVLADVARDGLTGLFDNDGTLHRLRYGSSAEELRAGRVTGTGYFNGRETPPVCYAAHQYYVSGKNGGWRTDYTAWLTEGATLTLRDRTWAVDHQFIDFEPLETSVAGPDFEFALRRRANGFPDAGRVVYACVDQGAYAFVDACVDDRLGRLVTCPGGGSTVVTRGSATSAPRVRQMANGFAARLSAGLLLLVALSLYVWRAARAGTLVDALRGWSTAPETPSRTPIIAALVSAAVLVWLIVLARTVGHHGADEPYLAGYGFGASTLAGALIALLYLRDRRVKLSLAMAPCIAAETSRLARVGDGPAELAVRVRNDAPTVTLRDHPPHAFVRVSVKRIVQSGRNQVTVPFRTVAWPETLPVEDPSGPGVLEMKGAEVDLRANFRVLRGDDARGLLASYGSTPFGDQSMNAMPFTAIEVEESFADAGEKLYVLGTIHRVQDPDANTQYREMSTVPVIGTREPTKLAVYAGSEGALVASLRRERAVVTAAAVVLSVASVTLLAALVYLRAL
jgi:hypothetical protein